MAAYFVTGTDTGVGKTLVTAGLLRVAAARGLYGIGLKPVAAGSALLAGAWVNEDALLLQRAATVPLAYADVNPLLLRSAIAPHLAAAEEGVRPDVKALATHCRAQARRAHDLLLAEGAGGWLVPLDTDVSMADLAVALGWPVIMVVGMRLGCLNHALLTAAAIRAAGLTLAGWVANSPAPEMSRLNANVATLEARLAAPRLGTVPWLGADAAAEAVAACLDLGGLRLGSD